MSNQFNSIIYGTNGNDFLNAAGSGSSHLIAEKGDDFVFGGSGNDSIEGGGGNDRLTGYGGDDTLIGGLGDDTFILADGNDTILDFSFGDRILVNSQWPVKLIKDVDGDWYLRGQTPNNAEVNTKIIFEKGYDLIQSDTGIVTLRPELVTGPSDPPPVPISTFDPVPVFSDNPPHNVDGDLIRGTDEKDYLYGAQNNDQIYGQYGEDTLFGSDGDDLLKGAGDNDLVEGGDGNDSIFGGSGEDVLIGGNGDDDFKAGSGADQIHAGFGNDTIITGGGDDVLIFENGDFGGNNLIKDFNLSGDDVIHFKDVSDTFSVSGFGTDTLKVEDGGSLIAFIVSEGSNFTQADVIM